MVPFYLCVLMVSGGERPVSHAAQPQTELHRHAFPDLMHGKPPWDGRSQALLP